MLLHSIVREQFTFKEKKENKKRMFKREHSVIIITDY